MGISISLTLEKYLNFEQKTLWWSYAIAIHKINVMGTVASPIMAISLRLPLFLVHAGGQSIQSLLLYGP